MQDIFQVLQGTVAAKTNTQEAEQAAERARSQRSQQLQAEFDFWMRPFGGIRYRKTCDRGFSGGREWKTLASTFSGTFRSLYYTPNSAFEMRVAYDGNSLTITSGRSEKDTLYSGNCPRTAVLAIVQAIVACPVLEIDQDSLPSDVATIETRLADPKVRVKWLKQLADMQPRAFATLVASVLSPEELACPSS